MKTVFLAFLLFTFLANILLSSSQNIPPPPVRDTSGQELRRGVNYYILPAERGTGGGVTVANDRGVRCPYRIVQGPVEGNNGTPVVFSPINPNDTIIRLNIDLNIKFTSTPSNCPESTVWKLNVTQSSTPPFYVTVDGVEGNPSPDTVTSWFKISRDDDDDDDHDDGYEIQFCPSASFCPPGVFCNLLCDDIGTIVGAGLKRLAFDQETFKVVFQRA